MIVALACGCAPGAGFEGGPGDGSGAGGKADGIEVPPAEKKLREVCRFYEPMQTAGETEAELCTCLGSKLASATHERLCGQAGELTGWLDGMRGRVRREVMASLTEAGGGADSARCVDSLGEFRDEILLDQLLDACEDGDHEILGALENLPVENTGRCWTMQRMTRDGCIEATPCAGSGPADPGALPVTDASLAALGPTVDEGTRLTLCHGQLAAIHTLKDPVQANHPFNFSFVNLLAWGQSAARTTFGPANCHGTAQAIAGGFLDATPVRGVTYHSDAVRQQCGEWAEAAFSAARQRAGGRDPVAGDLPIERGGHSINMDHGSSDARQCGDVKLTVYDCDDPVRPVAYAFHEGMSVACWTSHLEAAGYRDVSSEQDYRALDAGCVLTGNDHTITVLLQNEGMCSYYEATTPFGPPLLRVESCVLLPSQFEHRMCPPQPLELELRR